MPGIDPDKVVAGTESALVCDFPDLERSGLEQVMRGFQPTGGEISGEAHSVFAVKAA